MITAKVRFLANNLVAELTSRADEIRCGLEETGILTPLNLIKLDKENKEMLFKKECNNIQ